jgi:hypothetical protein
VPAEHARPTLNDGSDSLRSGTRDVVVAMRTVWRTATARRPVVAVTLAALKAGWRNRDTA